MKKSPKIITSNSTNIVDISARYFGNKSTTWSKRTKSQGNKGSPKSCNLTRFAKDIIIRQIVEKNIAFLKEPKNATKNKFNKNVKKQFKKNTL